MNIKYAKEFLLKIDDQINLVMVLLFESIEQHDELKQEALLKEWDILEKIRKRVNEIL